MKHIYFSLLMLVSLAAASPTCAAVAEDEQTPSIQKDELGSTPNVTRFGKMLFGGQPDAAALEEAKKRGIKVLISVREEHEVKWDEAGKAEELGMEFYRFGFRAPESLTDELLDRARKTLVDSQDKPTMLYCGSANRAGAIWTAYRALEDGLSVDEALKEGRQVGLRNEAYVAVVKDYIKRNKKQAQ